MQATQLAYGEQGKQTAAVDRGASTQRGPLPGIVFVPCVLCLEPVDLTVAREAAGRPLCEPHRAAERSADLLRLA
jgi:hypothetical protein